MQFGILNFHTSNIPKKISSLWSGWRITLWTGIVSQPIKSLALLFCQNGSKRCIVLVFVFQHMPNQINILTECRTNLTCVHAHNLRHQSRTCRRRESAILPSTFRTFSKGSTCSNIGHVIRLIIEFLSNYNRIGKSNL